LNKTISYSQFASWYGCPYRWKLKYIDDVGEDSENINLVFGKAMHATVQEYLTRYYKESVAKANELDMSLYLKEKMKSLFLESKNKQKVMDLTKEDMLDAYYDGVKTLEWLKRRIEKYFQKLNWELVGIELPLVVPIRSGITFKGYLDVVLRNTRTGIIKILDLKTSRMGWKDKQKADFTKRAQLVIYKHYYAKQFDIPIENISVEFIVLKRKIYEGADFPIPRIQVVEPPTGSVTIHKTLEKFNEFINACFILNEHNVEGNFPAMPSKDNCKWCKYNQTEYCKGMKTVKRKSK
jgi:RecB family exonuclease